MKKAIVGGIVVAVIIAAYYIFTKAKKQPLAYGTAANPGASPSQPAQAKPASATGATADKATGSTATGAKGDAPSTQQPAKTVQSTVISEQGSGNQPPQPAGSNPAPVQKTTSTQPANKITPAQQGGTAQTFSNDQATTVGTKKGTVPTLVQNPSNNNFGIQFYPASNNGTGIPAVALV